jgi:adenylate cyclase class 2
LKIALFRDRIGWRRINNKNMQIEYEATFTNINKAEIRGKLEAAGARLLKPEFFQKRIVFSLPEGHEIKGGWLRVRDEGDKITMSLKIIDGEKIEDQKEICLGISDFGLAVNFLKTIGCRQKAYQESKRELWTLNGVEITIDEWPFLEPFVEIEAQTEVEVKETSRALGFDYSQALFCSVDTLYSAKYGVPKEVINNEISEILFDMKNPFEN